MKKDDLILSYVKPAQVNTPSIVIVGILDIETDDRLVVKCPFSTDLSYFSLIGKRLKNLTNAEEVSNARQDKSIRALPQLTPSDYLMMSIDSYTNYINATIEIYKQQIIYSIVLHPNSPFGRAFGIAKEQLVETAPTAQYYNESLFQFDSDHYLRQMADPNKISDAFVPNSTITSK